MPSLLAQLKQELTDLGNPEKATFLRGYFKTGPGEYAEGDELLGLSVPVMRKLAKKYKGMPLLDVQKLLKSKIHEFRYTALLLLVQHYERGTKKTQEKVVQIYLGSMPYVNNWDLVDTSAPYILGPHLYKKDQQILDTLVASGNLWQQRIAVLTTFYFIKQGEYTTTLKLAEKLINHQHDLIHKAVGWMLREIGNQDITTEEKFLKKHYKKMPRTMLRYAIEKFPETKRQAYLKGKV